LTAEKTRAPPADPDEFQLVDVKQVKQWVQFVLHSVRRRKWAVLGVWALVVALTVAVLAILPRTYQVDAQLLTQRHTVMPALGNPGRTVPTEANVPTRAAAETVLGHDNLLSLMKQTDLLNQWERSRTPILRFKDWVVRSVTNPSEEDRVNSMVGFLESRFHITTAESTITIGIDWPDRTDGLQPGGQRSAELPRAAPLGRGVQHRGDDLHPREPRHRAEGADRHRHRGGQAQPASVPRVAPEPRLPRPGGTPPGRAEDARPRR
jgi:hypothetical protein